MVPVLRSQQDYFSDLTRNHTKIERTDEQKMLTNMKSLLQEKPNFYHNAMAINK